MEIKSKNNKKGISLIVLVITIIVMIILATAVILSLSSNGIIDRANEAVDKTDLAQVQTLASTIWAEAYLDYREGKITDIYDKVITNLNDSLGMDTPKEDITDYYDIEILDTGIEVTLIEECEVHSEIIPAGGTYYVGVTGSYISDYTGYTAKYVGVSPEVAIGIDSNIKFGEAYVSDDGSMMVVLHTDGSAEIYSSGEYLDEMISGILTYSENSIYIGEQLFATVVEEGKIIDATASFGSVFNYDPNARVKFPKNISEGDVYIYGDYEYRYNRFFGIFWLDKTLAEKQVSGELENGWGVLVRDKTKTSYDPILENINGQMVTALWMTFCECENITRAPSIPKGITSMYDTFLCCNTLKYASKLPNGIKYLIRTFEQCELLKRAPVIPSSVEDMTNAFLACTSLTGTIVINANPTKYDDCLGGTGITQVIGDTTMADELLATVNE